MHFVFDYFRDYFRKYEMFLSTQRTFKFILLLALLIRLAAVVGINGYVGFDSQWLVIENAQNWANGEPFTGVHTGHHFFYPLLHSFLFLSLQHFGIFDPMTKMLFVRLFHALYSLLTVWLGYKMTLFILRDENQYGGSQCDESQYDGRQSRRYLIANKVALFLSVFWFFPFHSVFSYIEMVCIPPMMLGFYYLLQVEAEATRAPHQGIPSKMFGKVVLGIFWLMVASMLRYQVIIMVVAVGLVLLYWQQWRTLFIAVLTGCISLFLLFGLPDKIILHQFLFYSLSKYVEQNITNMGGYVSAQWYIYFALLLGSLIPPVSLLIMGGALRAWKNSPMLVFSIALFFLFHMLISNRQERFIFPVVPLLIMMGTIGYSLYWKEFLLVKIPGIYKASWVFFVLLNTLLLLVTINTYYKRSNVETAYFFSQKSDVEGVAYDSRVGDVDLLFHLPFYMQKKYQVPFWEIKALDYTRFSPDLFRGNKKPNYVVFVENENLQERVEKFSNYFSVKLNFEKTIEPSKIDQLLHYLNPYNRNLTTHIYRADFSEN